MLRRVRSRAIKNEFRTENFRGRKILRSKSREIAPKSVSLGDAQPRTDPERSRTSVPSVSMLRRGRLHALWNEFFFRPQSERIHNRGRETPYISFALNHRSGEVCKPTTTTTNRSAHRPRRKTSNNNMHIQAHHAHRHDGSLTGSHAPHQILGARLSTA